MKLTDHDLLQIDREYLASLGQDALLQVSKKLLEDLKEARDRLNQTPENSSVPPSSQPAYLGTLMDESDSTEESDEENDGPSSQSQDKSFPEDDSGEEEDSDTPPADDSGATEGAPDPQRNPGKQTGAPGHGRTQVIPPQKTQVHRALICSACSAALESDKLFIARLAFYVLDLEVGTSESPGLSICCTKHVYGDTECSCGHVTRTVPGTGDQYELERGRGVTHLSEWRLIGPMLASFIVFLTLRMRLSRARVKEFLKDWLEVDVSVGTINNCIHEAGLAAAPVHQELVDQVRESDLAHVDETPWKEHGRALWLWVFSTASVVLFFIGRRTRQVALDILTAEYSGWLMSDGLMNYRIFKNRLRCLSHLTRKAKGLADSLNQEARTFGLHTLDVLSDIIGKIKENRTSFSPYWLLDDFKLDCEYYAQLQIGTEKSRSLAGEFLNDWDTIWRVLEFPELPLTNNEAERALRHWVIARLISHGTRTKEGSRAFYILASVIETCRKRGVSTWQYLAEVITQRRKGNLAPPIPLVALTA